MYGDNTLMDSAYVVGNTMTDCSFAIHGYYGGSGEEGVLTFKNNIVTGSDELACKIVIQDQTNTGALKVDITGNTLENALVGLVNLCEDGEIISDVLQNNNFYDNSFYVEALEPGTIKFYTTFEAPACSVGNWVNNGLNYTTYKGWCESQLKASFKEVHGGEERFINTTTNRFDNNLFNPVFKEFVSDEGIQAAIDAAFTQFEKVVQDAIDEANKTGSHTLTIITMDTTLISDAVALTGETVDFVLTSTVPEDLANYLEITDANAPSVYADDEETTSRGSYLLVFHDTMDENLTLDVDSIVVTINGKTLSKKNKEYFVAVPGDYCESGCTFEVYLDLVKLYNSSSNYFTKDDFGEAPIVVTYSATTSVNLLPGMYVNTAWVQYEGGESSEDTADVTTYGMNIFKYDQVTGDGLYNAEFELYLVKDITEEVKAGIENNENVEYDEAVDDDNDGEYDHYYKYEKVATVNSAADGYVLIKGLDAGTYLLYETVAPDGYVKSAEPLTIVIPDNVKVGVEGYDDYYAYVMFANSEIPQTGGRGTTMYTIGGIVILLAAGIILIVSRKKKEDK